MSLFLPKLVLLYGLFQAAFETFKVLHKVQRVKKMLKLPENRGRFNERQILRALDKSEVLPLLQVRHSHAGETPARRPR